MNVPLIIPNFNQFTYLKNLINWYKWYYPNAPIHIVDNASTYQPLLDWYDLNPEKVTIHRYESNIFITNLNDFLKKNRFEWYIISDADIMPHPATPYNFVEVWMDLMKKSGYHRAGFDLITYDIPVWNEKAGWIQGDEVALHGNIVAQHMNFNAYKAPIDTTFALYRSANGGWYAPMSGQDWGNCIRLFNAFHLTWYIDGERINAEMDNYFTTAKYRVIGEPSAGMNNSRPKKYEV